MSEETGPEIPRDEFIALLKKRGSIWASPSHDQRSPTHVSSFAILKLQYDGEIYAINSLGNRVVISENMPAFHEHFDID